jgi:Tol biopolymer transport system component
MIGKTISHYRIVEKLGGGGMGVVYKGRDTLLDRPVAIKVLSPELLADETAARGFIREAKAASALNHPNILTVHDLLEAEGVHFLVTEFVDGQTLRGRIGKKGMELKPLLDVALEVAEALAAAHKAGIVHRDLKPENIMVRTDGHTKVVDFGLAKLLPTRPGILATGEPTLPLSAALPQVPGTGIEQTHIAGTLPYMSPEQLLGKPLDRRTDIFSFGVVLYEMATGQQPFQSRTTGELIEAILGREPPPVTQLSRVVPEKLQEMIAKALEKDPTDRYQGMEDLVVDLRRLKRVTDSGHAVAAAVAPPSRRQAGETPAVRWRRLAIGVAGAVVVAAVAVVYWLTHRPPLPPAQLTERRLTANPTENAVNTGAISPDGKYLAYGDQAGMHLKLIQTGETLNIPQPEGPAPDRALWFPYGWFPDSTKFIVGGVEAGQHLSVWVVSVMGGPPHKIRDDADPGPVSPDGALVAFGTGSGREIWLMGAQGEEPRRLVSGSANDEFFVEAWSPDGQRIAYKRYHRTPDGTECSIESRDLKGGQPILILSDPGLCRGMFLWYPGGRIIYVADEPEPKQGSNLWEIRVDTKTGQAVSKPRRLTNWAEVVAAHLSGTSDGKQLAVLKTSREADVYVGELEAGGRRLKNPRRLTLNENDDYPGRWMPDSKAVLFCSNRNGTWDIFKQALDQAEAQPIVTGPEIKYQPVVSPDGSWILYLSSATDELGPTAPVRIMRVPTSGGAPQLVLEGRGIVRLACAQSPATLCAFDEPSPDQKQVVISAFDPVQGKGKELTRINLRQPNNNGYSWDLSRDGSRLAFTQYDEREGRIQILPSAGGETREVKVKGWNGLSNLFWAADGKGLFVGVLSPTLIYVDLEGRADVLWQQRLGQGLGTRGVPSPDGRHLALTGHSVNSNMWMLENF